MLGSVAVAVAALAASAVAVVWVPTRRDSQEVYLNTNPLLQDSDGDGYTDCEDVMNGTNPLDHANDPTSV